MLGIKHFKAEPTEYARIRTSGKPKKEGGGISAIYIPLRTTIEMVNLATSDQPFVFNEVSKDNQDVALQGGFVYRIADPKLAIAQYNFSINPRTKSYISEDKDKLPQHILQLVRENTRGIVRATPLEELLIMGEHLSKTVTERLIGSPLVTRTGVEFKDLYFESIRPNPEIAKALETGYRESLLQRADEAIYARRAQAVENERSIQEEEMKTETEMEQGRKQLVELRGANALKEAEDKARAQMAGEKSAADAIVIRSDAESKALYTQGEAKAKITLAQGSAEARTTRAMGEARAVEVRKKVEAYKDADPGIINAQALLEFGRNANFGDITVTPEILTSIGSVVKYLKAENETG